MNSYRFERRRNAQPLLGAGLLKKLPAMDAVREVPDPIEAKYANYFQISHGSDEFLIDFGQAFTEEKAPALQVRIVMPPAQAELLFRMLGEVITHYRDVHVPPA